MKRSLTCAVPELSFVSISIIKTVPSGITLVPAASIGVPSRSRPDGGRPGRRWANTWVAEANQPLNRITTAKAARADLLEPHDLNFFFITLSLWPFFLAFGSAWDGSWRPTRTQARLNLQGEMRTYFAYGQRKCMIQAAYCKDKSVRGAYNITPKYRGLALRS
jgi:hypothetical protein